MITMTFVGVLEIAVVIKAVLLLSCDLIIKIIITIIIIIIIKQTN